jgi:hypothetical protein
MRKDRKNAATSSSDVPKELLALFEACAGCTGVSNEPEDNIWCGPDGKLPVFELLQQDLGPLSAADRILLAIIDANPKEGRSRMDRLKAVNAVLFNSPSGGRPPHDDEEYLRSVARAIFRRSLKGGPVELKDCIAECLQQEWNKLSKRERETLYRRLRSKFKKDKDRMLLWVSGADDEAQLWREQTVQDVLKGLEELGVLRKPPQ